MIYWNKDCNFTSRPFLHSQGKLSAILGALIVYLNGCQSMRRLLRLKVYPEDPVEILDVCVPEIGDFPEPVEPKNYLQPTPVRVASPKLLANVSYLTMHALCPTKNSKTYLEKVFRARATVSEINDKTHFKDSYIYGKTQ